MKFLIMFFVASIASLSTGTAFAADVDGEAHVQLTNAEYVKVEVNGTQWDNTEFEQGGKLLLIKGLDTTIDRNAVVLISRNDAFAPYELDVQLTSFKKVRKGRLYHLISKHSVTFAQKATDEPTPDPKVTPPAKPGAPAPAPAPKPVDDL